MGYSRKEEIARLKRERKEAKAAKKRQENYRDQHIRFLIVCEGKKTEPHYFEALIESHSSAVREVKVEGEGMATVALVNQTSEIKKDLDTYVQVLDQVAEANHYVLVALYVTDIINNGSYVIYNQKGESIMNLAYRNAIEEGTFIPGCLSRKKHIVPDIMEILES